MRKTAPMTFRIENRTRLKPGETRFDNLIARANARCEKFLALNPSRRDSTFIALEWRGNAYWARCRFRSDQGASTFDSVYEL